MPSLQNASLWVQNLADAMPMSLQSVHFLLFAVAAVVVFYLLRTARLRRGWLLVCSYYFYLVAAPTHLPVLLICTLGTYTAGRLAGRAKTAARRKAWAAAGIVAVLLVLLMFKYYKSFFAAFTEGFFLRLGMQAPQTYFTVAGALGISFYTFIAVGYLIEVGAGSVPCEKNLLTYALYVGFFPAVTSGPISRASGLLPQLQNLEGGFSSQNAADALRSIAVGYFKKLAVANTLGIVVDGIYKSPQQLMAVGGFTLMAGTVLFTVQLYFDFSGYTDIVRGVAKLFGVELPENFKNPFFATNFSGFWSRWHISLSSWLQDYIFTPLVWSRWTEKLPIVGKKAKSPPVLTSIVVVFLISGIWHGNTLCFVVWGALQALYRVGEELLHRKLGKPKKKISFWKRFGKNAVVLLLWSQSLVFFRVGLMEEGSVQLAFQTMAGQFKNLSLARTASELFSAVRTGLLPNTTFAALVVIFMLGCTALALWADWVQCFKWKGASYAQGLGQLKKPLRWVLYYGLVVACFAAFLLQNGGFLGGSFLYDNF